MLGRMLKEKKGKFAYWSEWAEVFFLILLFVGLLLGAASPSAAITYLVALVAGMITGRLIFERKNKFVAPYMLIVIGFIMGYVVGTFRGSRLITFLLFIFGAALVYYLFDKKIMKDFFV